MSEEMVFDSIILQLNDGITQKLLEEKVIDNNKLLVLAASDFTLH